MRFFLNNYCINNILSIYFNHQLTRRNKMKLYHYSNVKFDQIDMSKCDGFWMTDIAPDDANAEVIGIDSERYCYVCEVSDELEELVNGANEDVAQQLIDEDAEILVNKYDGFNDYAVADPSLVKIIEIINM